MPQRTGPDLESDATLGKLSLVVMQNGLQGDNHYSGSARLHRSGKKDRQRLACASREDAYDVTVAAKDSDRELALCSSGPRSVRNSGELADIGQREFVESRIRKAEEGTGKKCRHKYTVRKKGNVMLTRHRVRLMTVVEAGLQTEAGMGVSRWERPKAGKP